MFAISAEAPTENLFLSNQEYYQKEVSTEGHIACFAYDGSVIVGCGGICFYLEIHSPDNTNGICAYLMNIYTLPEFRKKGIGAFIVKWLISRAKERYVRIIYLETSENGKTLYHKIGFNDMSGYMMLKQPLIVVCQFTCV